MLSVEGERESKIIKEEQGIVTIGHFSLNHHDHILKHKPLEKPLNEFYQRHILQPVIIKVLITQAKIVAHPSMK